MLQNTLQVVDVPPSISGWWIHHCIFLGFTCVTFLFRLAGTGTLQHIKQSPRKFCIPNKKADSILIMSLVYLLLCNKSELADLVGRMSGDLSQLPRRAGSTSSEAAYPWSHWSNQTALCVATGPFLQKLEEEKVLLCNFSRRESCEQKSVYPRQNTENRPKK